MLQISLTFVNFADADRFAEARFVGHVGGTADIINLEKRLSALILDEQKFSQNFNQ